MTDEKMIEEMARVIYKRINTIEKFGLTGMELCRMVAKELVKHYQPKLPEDAVVLTKEEFERLKGIEELLDKGYFTTENRKAIYQARKEMAREIFAKLRSMGKINTEFDWNDYLKIDIDDFYKLEKEYGVEVKEL